MRQHGMATQHGSRTRPDLQRKTHCLTREIVARLPAPQARPREMATVVEVDAPSTFRWRLLPHMHTPAAPQGHATRREGAPPPRVGCDGVRDGMERNIALFRDNGTWHWCCVRVCCLMLPPRILVTSAAGESANGAALSTRACYGMCCAPRERRPTRHC